MKILFISLGCDKNLVDTENMLGELDSAGFSFTDREEEAEIIIINTCCFIHDAKEESINTILEMAEWKKKGVCKALIVTGCLAHRYKEEVLKEIPEVDAILGTTSIDKIVSVVKETEKKQGIACIEDTDRLPVTQSNRLITTGGYFEYLKIAEGCDKHCTYCIIPKVRGNYRSYPMDYLIRQATYLASCGTKELILVAQETTVYGTDLYKRKAFPELLTSLCRIDGIEWIRILYCYPEEITEELIAVMKREPKICHYLDMPIQHASDPILKRMGRHTSHADLISIISRLRQEIPDIALRTTMITGFPGETEEDFQKLVAFVKEVRFDRLGVFTYSPEEDTPAAEMPDQIPEAIKEKRRNILMELQQQISTEISAKMVGKTIPVIVDGYIPDDLVYTGRTYKDTPNVDGMVFIHSDQELISGQIVPVQITASTEYDLIGDLTDSSLSDK